jgi:hypothetical protein
MTRPSSVVLRRQSPLDPEVLSRMSFRVEGKRVMTEFRDGWRVG